MIPGEISEAITKSGKEQISPSFTILSAESLPGGCINQVHRISTSGGDFCVKFNNRHTFPNLFECEAAGLGLLKNTEVIKVPEVIFTGTAGDYSFILLEFIAAGRKRDDLMEDFGRSLALLHLNSEDYFGLDHDNYMGSLQQSNEQHDDWISFFIDERIERQVNLAHSKKLLTNGHISGFSKLCYKLPSLLCNEPPALLHGDLWNGNYMISEEGKAALIDPAVYYGNREADLAMTQLFGGFDNDFYESYNESYPVISGWKERILIYQLYPLLIHLNLFGRSYLGQIEDVLEKFL